MSWLMYSLVYLCIVLFYLSYRYIFWGAAIEEKPPKHARVDDLISVVVPVYNEDPQALLATLTSISDARGNKEVFVVDDGSPNRAALEKIYKVARGLGFKVLYLERNMGKRHAQLAAFKIMRGAYVATVDSDTTIDENALVYAAHYLEQHDGVGAVTGMVRARNASKNLLTRMIDARYVNAFRFERKSQSALDLVTCCCGSLSVYRVSIVRELMHRYATQRFLGMQQNFGDDRHLTNLIIMQGLGVRFLSYVRATTDVPEKLKQFLKQQLRWNQSFVRENVVLARYAFTKSFMLSLELILVSVIPFMALPLRLAAVALLFVFPSIALQIAASIAVMGALRNVWMLADKALEKRMHLLGYNILYGFLHFATVYWLLFVAVFKVYVQRNTAWGTRSPEVA